MDDTFLYTLIASINYRKRTAIFFRSFKKIRLRSRSRKLGKKSRSKRSRHKNRNHRLRGGDCVNQKDVKTGADKDPITLADIPLNRKIRVTISENKYFCFDRHTLLGNGIDEQTGYLFFSSIKNPLTNQDFTKQQIIEILTQVKKGVFYFNPERGGYAIPVFLYQYITNNFTADEKQRYFDPLISQ